MMQTPISQCRQTATQSSAHREEAAEFLVGQRLGKVANVDVAAYIALRPPVLHRRAELQHSRSTGCMLLSRMRTEDLRPACRPSRHAHFAPIVGSDRTFRRCSGMTRIELHAVCRKPSGGQRVQQIAADLRPSSSVRTISDGLGTCSEQLAGGWPAAEVLREVVTCGMQHGCRARWRDAQHRGTVKCGTRRCSPPLQRNSCTASPYARAVSPCYKFEHDMCTILAIASTLVNMFSLRRKGQAEKRATTPSPVAASPHAGDLKIGAFRPGWLPDDATAREPAAQPQVRSCLGYRPLAGKPLIDVPPHQRAGFVQVRLGVNLALDCAEANLTRHSCSAGPERWARRLLARRC